MFKQEQKGGTVVAVVVCESPGSCMTFRMELHTSACGGRQKSE